MNTSTLYSSALKAANRPLTQHEADEKARARLIPQAPQAPEVKKP